MQHKIIYGIFGGLWSSLVRSCRKEHGRCQHCCESCMSACVAAIPCCVCCDHRIISFWRAAQFRQKSCSLSWQINIKSQKWSASGLFGLAFNFFFFPALLVFQNPCGCAYEWGLSFLHGVRLCQGYLVKRYLCRFSCVMDSGSRSSTKLDCRVHPKAYCWI